MPVVVDESITVDASAHEVWRTIVVAEARAGWWKYLDLDATVGGRFVERWTDGSGRERLTTGVVTEVVVDRLLVLCWADEDWPAATQVAIRLAQVGGTTLHRSAAARVVRACFTQTRSVGVDAELRRHTPTNTRRVDPAPSSPHAQAARTDNARAWPTSSTGKEASSGSIRVSTRRLRVWV
jgi:uncharacterized protein YndB with AHSA1/START domain